MLSIVQLSDLHFGPKHLDDKVRCLEEVLTFLQDWPADVAAIPGDIYDHALRLEDDAAQQSVRLFSALAERCPLLIVRGNFTHDRASVHLLHYVRGRFPIHVSTEPEALWFTGTEFVTVDPAGSCPPQALALCCTLPYPSSAFLARTRTLGPQALQDLVSCTLTEILRGFAALVTPPDLPRILLFHGAVRGARLTETQHAMGLDIEVARSDIEQAGFHLACCGHLHYPQQLGQLIFYTRGLTHDTFGEEGDKGVWLHTLTGTSVTSEFRPVSSVPQRLFEVDLTENPPFLLPPPWADEPCDVKVRVHLHEEQLATLRTLDLHGLFPHARSLQVERLVIPVIAVRCDAVRHAHSLPEKIRAYMEYTGQPVPSSLLTKAQLLSALDDSADALIAQVQAAFTAHDALTS